MTGSGPAFAAQDSSDVFLDTAAMMLYPADIDAAGIGTMCIQLNTTHLAERDESAGMEFALGTRRDDEGKEIAAELVADGKMVSLREMISNGECSLEGFEPSEDYYAVVSTVMEQERRGGARDVFDFVADESTYTDENYNEVSEYEDLESPDLGDESDLNLKWVLDEDDDRAYWQALRLTVRVDRLVGQVLITSTRNTHREPSLDPIIELGERMVERMEDALNAKKSPASTLPRLVDPSDADPGALDWGIADSYYVFDGSAALFPWTTTESLQSRHDEIQNQEVHSNFTRLYSYTLESGDEFEITLRHVQYASADAAEAAFEYKVEQFEGIDPDEGWDIVDLDGDLGDEHWAAYITTDEWTGTEANLYVGVVLAGDKVIQMYFLSETVVPDLESFETLMEFQGECISSRSGCDGPLDVADVFG
jgi:hypothetical protein